MPESNAKSYWRSEAGFWTMLGGAVVLVGVAILAVWPQYKVYQQRLDGEAKLRRSESERQVQVEDAKAKKEAATLLAAAEVERAKGIAEANAIIGKSLSDNPLYLTYQWIEKVNENGNSVIYVPTEAGIPLFNPGRPLGQVAPKK